ncbi:MAG: hypothetical protein AAGK02_08250, partial [Pseudomonadota bacterium]
EQAGDDRAAETLLIRHLAGEPYNTEAVWLLALRSAAGEDWLRVEVLLDYLIELGVGNDPELLELRARAASEQGKNEDVDRIEDQLRGIRPSPFVAPVEGG